MRIVERIGRHSYRVVRDDERAALIAERDRYWQALVDIAGWENWQDETWREIAQKALSEAPSRGRV